METNTIEQPATSVADNTPNTGMILRTDDLVKKYRQRTVVNHVSINVTQGEIVGLLGPNGAGKSAATGRRTLRRGCCFLTVDS